MNDHVKMRPCRLKMESTQMTLEAALDWCAAHIRQGWLLCESPESVIWRPLYPLPQTADLGACLYIIAFGPESELRWQRKYGQEQGATRLITQDDQGEQGLERLSSYIVPTGKGRLKYAEFFQPDEQSGLLRLQFARYCGMGGE